ncbi:hypothetical protein Btru_069707, partial [Bulinus truncatus]
MGGGLGGGRWRNIEDGRNDGRRSGRRWRNIEDGRNDGRRSGRRWRNIEDGRNDGRRSGGGGVILRTGGRMGGGLGGGGVILRTGGTMGGGLGGGGVILRTGGTMGGGLGGGGVILRTGGTMGGLGGGGVILRTGGTMGGGLGGGGVILRTGGMMGGAMVWVWKTVRRFHFGTVCLGITFVASVVILANISNMHVQVHRSFLSFSRNNETLLNVCLDLRERMQVAIDGGDGLANETGALAPTVTLTTPMKEENLLTGETVTCDLSKFKKGLPVAGDEKLQNSQGACPEKPSTLFGRFSPSMMPMTMEEMVSMFPVVQKGGRYTPRWCKPTESIIIVIPFKYRCTHLHTLLPVLISMLIRQNVQFTIYVVEQISPGKFNKGLLFNAGYLEALKKNNFDCIILHDVDLIPVNDMNLYRCNKTGPIHFSPIISKFNFKELYNGLFGGVVGFTRDHFQKINGASNLFFGWGAEDDDLRN